MMSSTLGAPVGGTTRGGHHGVDSEALSLITPPNFGSGGGSCLPSSVVVAVGEPGVPVICCARTVAGTSIESAQPTTSAFAVIEVVFRGSGIIKPSKASG